jgi:hypothetical protein
LIHPYHVCKLIPTEIILADGKRSDGIDWAVLQKNELTTINDWNEIVDLGQ